MMEAACDAEKWTWESLLNELTWTFDSPKVRLDAFVFCDIDEVY